MSAAARRHPRRRKILRTTLPALTRASSYASRVLSLSPVVYLPLWESSGGVAYDQSGNNCHAAYSSVTLGQPGIGDGNTSIYINGVSGYVDLYSTLFNSLLNRQQGSFALWVRADASLWSDGVEHHAFMIYSNVDKQYFMMGKYVNNDILSYRYKPATVVELVHNTAGTLDWFHVGMSWNVSASRWRAYFNGAKLFDDGGTVSAFGSGLNPDSCLLGGVSKNLNVWKGFLAHAALFDRELSETEMSALSQV